MSEDKSPINELLKAFSEFLEEHGYTDSDWRDEEPNAIKRFLTRQDSIEKENVILESQSILWQSELKLKDDRIKELETENKRLREENENYKRQLMKFLPMA